MIRRRSRTRWALLAVAAAVVVTVAACSGEGTRPTVSTVPDQTTTPAETTTPPETTEAPETTAPPETTEAPETTAPPETTEPEGEGGGNGALVLIVALAGLAILVLVVLGARSSRRKDVAISAAAPSWKERARTAYANSRWVYDTLTEDLAIWRGNTRVDGITDPGSANATAWEQLPARMDAALAELYALESAAPDARTAQVARRVVDTLKGVRTAIDSRVEARVAFRTEEAGPADAPDRQARLDQARDRERRASENLAAARTVAAEALTELSSLT